MLKLMSIGKKIMCTALGLLMTAVTAAGSFYYSTASVNFSRYPVWGVDVSNYQGIINWEMLEEQDVSFAFIKATEGSGHVDESVRRNLENAAQTDIIISAYHFFSFDSPGESQADNFIKTVGADEIDMPPVVDVEYYGDKRLNKPTREETLAILRPLLEKLEEHYGSKPLIYTTFPVYMRYMREDFADYPLWIRSINGEPDLLDWKFWQYSDKGLLDGYAGDEKYIDLNVYNGSEAEFREEFSKNDTF